MSLFDYPRINFHGTIQLNPGTANNDDYAPAVVLPDSYGAYAGCPLGLIISKTVQPRTYGKSDEEFIDWVQKKHVFEKSDKSGPTREIIPAEWNYYGAMNSQDIEISVVGVQSGDGPNLDSLIGGKVSYSGHFTDVNSEGSPPATQFFIDALSVTNSTTTFPPGKASKGACQWLNFYRNVNLVQDAGAGGYVYHVIRTSDGAKINLPGFDDPNIKGVICRYYLYGFAAKVSGNDQIEALYQQKKTNPATLEIVGTFAPLLATETIFTGPVGRLLVCNTTNIKTPGTNNNGNPDKAGGGNLIALAPAVLQVKGNTVSVDFSGTFPDNSQGPGINPKFDFGPVTLMVGNAGGSAPIGPVDYNDTDAGNSRGWIFDFDISSNTAAQQILKDPAARFSLKHDTYGAVLEETDYYFVSNQQGIYAEQNGPRGSFLNQGTYEPATVAVYHRGRELGAGECPPITVWQYRTVPSEDPGNFQTIATNFKPGDSLQVDTGTPGNFLFTFGIGNQAGFPPQSYNQFENPPYITNAPSISLRILPNDEDFSNYYVDPNAKEPVGNDQLTFDIVYQKVLRTYYLLYPSMNKVFALNSVTDVTGNAPLILKRTDPKLWMSAKYMPRTRDMSASRCTLLQAWCRKVIAAGKGS